MVAGLHAPRSTFVFVGVAPPALCQHATSSLLSNAIMLVLTQGLLLCVRNLHVSDALPLNTSTMDLDRVIVPGLGPDLGINPPRPLRHLHPDGSSGVATGPRLNSHLRRDRRTSYASDYDGDNVNTPWRHYSYGYSYYTESNNDDNKGNPNGFGWGTKNNIVYNYDRWTTMCSPYQSSHTSSCHMAVYDTDSDGYGGCNLISGLDKDNDGRDDYFEFYDAKNGQTGATSADGYDDWTDERNFRAAMKWSEVSSGYSDGIWHRIPVSTTSALPPCGDSQDNDKDGDGVPNFEDHDPYDFDESMDSDSDGVMDNKDNFSNPNVLGNRFQYIDTDTDGQDNYADTDDDGDGVLDENDAFPIDSSRRLDTDGDGLADNVDVDDDNDRVLDSSDRFPLNRLESTDVDSDGKGDNRNSTDVDNDGVANHLDAQPHDAVESKDSDSDGVCDVLDGIFKNDPSECRDADSDGIGDTADGQFSRDPSRKSDSDSDGLADEDPIETDDDNDGLADNLDRFPKDKTEQYDNYKVNKNNQYQCRLGSSSNPVPDSIGDSAQLLNNPDNYKDFDSDGLKDLCDPDDDDDGIIDEAEPSFRLDKSEQYDNDSDGIGNNQDNDDDGDGCPDSADKAPLDNIICCDADSNGSSDDSDGDGVCDTREPTLKYINSETTDADSDGVGDNADACPNYQYGSVDSDGDGYCAPQDKFPNDKSEWFDTDNDGIGDNSDFDIDGDGYFNVQMVPLFPNKSILGGYTYPSSASLRGVEEKLDDFPTDSLRHTDTDHDGVEDSSDSIPNCNPTRNDCGVLTAATCNTYGHTVTDATYLTVDSTNPSEALACKCTSRSQQVCPSSPCSYQSTLISGDVLGLVNVRSHICAPAFESQTLCGWNRNYAGMCTTYDGPISSSNPSVCSATNNYWQCNCQPGWTHIQTSLKQDCDALSDPCQAYSPCNNLDTGATCVTSTTWTSKALAEKIHLDLQPPHGSYQCACSPGFSGKNCEIDLCISLDATLCNTIDPIAKCSRVVTSTATPNFAGRFSKSSCGCSQGYYGCKCEYTYNGCTHYQYLKPDGCMGIASWGSDRGPCGFNAKGFGGTCVSVTTDNPGGYSCSYYPDSNYLKKYDATWVWATVGTIGGLIICFCCIWLFILWRRRREEKKPEPINLPPQKQIPRIVQFKNAARAAIVCKQLKDIVHNKKMEEKMQTLMKQDINEMKEEDLDQLDAVFQEIDQLNLEDLETEEHDDGVKRTISNIASIKRSRKSKECENTLTQAQIAELDDLMSGAKEDDFFTVAAQDYDWEDEEDSDGAEAEPQETSQEVLDEIAQITAMAQAHIGEDSKTEVKSAFKGGMPSLDLLDSLDGEMVDDEDEDNETIDDMAPTNPIVRRTTESVLADIDLVAAMAREKANKGATAHSSFKGGMPSFDLLDEESDDSNDPGILGEMSDTLDFDDAPPDIAPPPLEEDSDDLDELYG